MKKLPDYLNKNYIRKEVISQALRNIDLFDGLPQKEIDIISGICEMKKYKKGDIIFHDDDFYTGFYCVADGIVKIYKETPEGKEKIIHVVPKYFTFAEVPVFESYEKIHRDTAKFPASSASIADGTKLIHVPAKQFLAVLSENTDICLNLLSGLSRKLKILQMQVLNVKSQDVTKRLITYLLIELEEKEAILSHNLDSPDSNVINLKISKIDLSAYLGATLETLSRTFKKLQDEKLLIVKGRKFTIPNIPKLKALLKQKI